MDAFLATARREYDVPAAETRATQGRRTCSERFVLALDQGTTSSRAIVFDQGGQPVATAQQEYPQGYPFPGHVTHDPEDIWQSQLAVARQAVDQVPGGIASIAALGVTNQRETTIVWERATGSPRGAGHRLAEPHHRRSLRPPARGRARAARPRADGAAPGRLLQRPQDRPHPRCRARTARTCRGRRALLRHRRQLPRLAPDRRPVAPHGRLERQPHAALRHLRRALGPLALRDRSACPWPCSRRCGPPRPRWPRRTRASSVRACPSAASPATRWRPCSARPAWPPAAPRPPTAPAPLPSSTRAAGPWPRSTACSPRSSGSSARAAPLAYALEGAVFVAGAAVRWLRDGLRAIEHSSDVEALAARGDRESGVVVVPAFVGLGAPYWDPDARGTIAGLTLGSRLEDIVLATVDAMAYQVADVLGSMTLDAGGGLAVLRVDGGAAVNDALLQFQADILDVPVERPRVTETTALGAAFLAGLATGVWSSTEEIAATWQLERRFEPAMEWRRARATAGALATGRRARPRLGFRLGDRTPASARSAGRPAPWPVAAARSAAPRWPRSSRRRRRPRRRSPAARGSRPWRPRPGDPGRRDAPTADRRDRLPAAPAPG